MIFAPFCSALSHQTAFIRQTKLSEIMHFGRKKLVFNVRLREGKIFCVGLHLRNSVRKMGLKIANVAEKLTNYILI